jgi:ribosomal-protein-alanine N-acetyltransferase
MCPSDKQHPLIRRLTPDDMELVFSIEQAAYPFPWSREVLNGCLRDEYACFGLQLGNNLAAYSISNSAAGEAHLMNLCVHPDWQHKGLGTLLLEYTITHATRVGNSTMFLEVRTSNPLAATLYENRGFVTIGHRPAYYKAGAGREDAIVMRLELSPWAATSPKSVSSS